MKELVGLVPLFPLLGFIMIGLLGKRLPKSVAGILASLLVLASFGVSLGIFIELSSGNPAPHTLLLFDWISAGSVNISLSFLVDPLSSLFLLIITGIGFLIHIYSIGYMKEDEGFNRFFSYLNLFVFFMLLLVLGANYLVMFVGWEGVGLCSYLLIGFWFKNPEYSKAANKAFIMNRIGDLGFLLGIFLLFSNFNSFDYATIFSQASRFSFDDPQVILITALLFIGAMGKSAQVPLYTWLPDAMAGPTPVSALIHAATMVTAGIYMICRSNILYTLAPFTLEIISVVGLVTALIAAIIALTQNDIKKVLAYSTVSQLGLMFLALGTGSYATGVFHVTTHAFFKALLFLGAGSVIHAMSGEQDIRNMGGLRKYLPVTYAVFLIATLAISGIPPFAGFFSKDEILAHAFAHNKVYWVLGLAVSLCTAFYMFRLFFLTFSGGFRGTHEQEHHLHESPAVMTLPLIVLAILSVVGGFIGIPEIFHFDHALNGFLEPVFAASHDLVHHAAPDHNTEWMLMGITVALVIVTIGIAWFKYGTKKQVPAAEGTALSPLHKLSYNKFYVDELYNTAIVKPLAWFSANVLRFIEVNVIDNLVNLSGRIVEIGGRGLKLVQQGSIGFYIFMMVLAIIVLLLTPSFI